MTFEATQDDLEKEAIFDNDIDPEEGLRELRRQEALASGQEEEDSSVESEEEPSDEILDELEDQDGELNSEDGTDDQDQPEAEEDPESEDLDDDHSDDQDAADQEPEPVKHKFKARGKEFEFTEKEMLDQFASVFGKAVDYTEKTQAIKPYRKMISAIEEQGITQEQLNIAIDALKGDKGALQALAKANSIDVFDLDAEAEKDYTPNQYGKDDKAIELEEVISGIAQDAEFQTTADIVDRQWDSTSRKYFADNPTLVQALHNDVKSGLYQEVAAEAAKMKVLDGSVKSDIEYYLIAGQEVQNRKQAVAEQQDTVNGLNQQAQEKIQNANLASSEAQRKRSASSTNTRSDRKKAIDYLNDDDEAFDEWYKKLEANN